jgi:hemerythrin-like metal-binding protein
LAESLAWSKDLEIGIPFIDADHRTLIGLLNQVEACVSANEETLTAGSVLNALDDYTQFHFSREERLQELCGYSGLAEHRRQHAELVKRLAGVRVRYQADPGQVSLHDVYRLIRDWFVRHVIAEDLPIREACGGNADALRAAEALRLDADTGVDWRRLRVLLVDDNPNFIRLLETVLAALGVGTVFSAISAREAMARLARHAVDVILVDWVMDGADGLDLVRDLKREGVTSRIVMITGFARADYRARAASVGVDGMIEKPISVRGLVRALGEALSK